MAEQNSKALISVSYLDRAKDNKDVMRLLGLSMNAQLKDNLKRIKAGEYIENCDY